MKKSLENLLFELLESGGVSLDHPRNFEESFLLINSNIDPLMAKISQAIDAPENVKVILSLRMQGGGLNNDTLIVPAKSLENFLLFVQHTKEREEAMPFIEEYGQSKFNDLKEDVLNILSEKTSKNFTLINDCTLDGMGNILFTVDDKKNKSSSIITIKQKQNFNHILPLKIQFQTLIKSEKYLKSTGLNFYISGKDLEQYPLMPMEKIKNKTEQEFLNDIIAMNNNPDSYVIKSKILDYFKLNTSLTEKDNNEKKLKI